MMRIGLVICLLALAGCAAPEPEPQPRLWLAERGVVWCYRTLADPDCYRVPLAGAERRLIAVAPEVFFTPIGLPATSLPAAPRAD